MAAKRKPTAPPKPRRQTIADLRRELSVAEQIIEDHEKRIDELEDTVNNVGRLIVDGRL